MHAIRSKLLIGLLVAVLVMASGALPAAAQDGGTAPPPAATMTVSADQIVWTPQVSYEYVRAIVTIAGPQGFALQQEFAAGAPVFLRSAAANGMPLPDGTYNYELQLVPRLSPEAQAAFAAAQESHDPAVVTQLQAAGLLPTGPFTSSGTFAVQNGIFVAGDETEGGFTANQTIADNLMVQGSLCVGIDCTSSENFGFDTIRLKENNLRIAFHDTSSTSGFPTNDWQITINDSANGGLSKFAIDDITNSKTPFTIEANAPTNSLYVDDGGRVGFGTSTPTMLNHLVNGNTPTVRLDQTGSSGFTPQVWDIAGNEANFFIRDATNGSKLPFRIAPGAPTNTIYLANNGRIGFGTATPSSALHLRRTDGSAQIMVEEASTTTSTRSLFQLKNNGQASMQFTNSATNVSWFVGGSNFGTNNLTLWSPSGGFLAKSQFALDRNGNVQVAGVLSQNATPTLSSATVSAASSEGSAILSKLGSVPIQSYQVGEYAQVTGPDGVSTEIEVIGNHLMPVPESFFQILGLGSNPESIAPMDVATVSMMAVQELQQQVAERDASITALEERLAELEATVAKLENLAHGHTYLPQVVK
ncbi:MAG: hypothetical protein H3C34_26635 [Caldilineaceae bacterium]|nr:hypothetical protein [Caldilineaceae bacterium]